VFGMDRAKTSGAQIDISRHYGVFYWRAHLTRANTQLRHAEKTS
jgi:hypothetical protein